ncbi:MAG: hypothetical protein LBR26_17325 [Prevotella sp.]|jgi:uncharacterized protein (TIGR02145 family)|nr:hypothetical protein [Prevotella sp.]
MKKTALFSILAAGILVGCSEDAPRLDSIPDRDNPKFEVANSDGQAVTGITASKDGSLHTVEVTTNTAWEWTASGATDWCTVTVPEKNTGNGTVTITVTENVSADLRQTSIVIGPSTANNTALMRTIALTQPGADAIIDFDPADAIIDTGMGGQTGIAVTSNASWTVTVTNGADWCSVTPASGSGNGAVTVTATRNTSSSPTRTATLTFIAGGVLTETVNVTQQGNAPYHEPDNSEVIHFDEFSPNPTLTAGAKFVLTDRRDGKSYNVRMMEDGHYWMTQDLKFALGNPLGDGKTTFQAVMNGSPRDPAYENWYGDYTNINPLAGRGYIYDFTAVVQVRNAFGTATSYPKTQGICPPGWHVPTATLDTDSGTGEYNLLIEALPDIADWMPGGKWDGVLGGNTDETASSHWGKGAYGAYWSSTINPSNASQARHMQIEGPGRNPANVVRILTTGRHYGLLVRCIMNY